MRRHILSFCDSYEYKASIPDTVAAILTIVDNPLLIVVVVIINSSACGYWPTLVMCLHNAINTINTTVYNVTA